MTNEKIKKNEPLITIVVPFYNGEQYLAECVNSILKQDYTNIEVILVDDGSKDNSYKIATDFTIKDNRVKLITRS